MNDSSVVDWIVHNHRIFQPIGVLRHSNWFAKNHHCLIQLCRRWINLRAGFIISDQAIKHDGGWKGRFAILSRYFNICPAKSSRSIRIDKSKKVPNDKCLPWFQNEFLSRAFAGCMLQFFDEVDCMVCKTFIESKSVQIINISLTCGFYQLACIDFAWNYIQGIFMTFILELVIQTMRSLNLPNSYFGTNAVHRSTTQICRMA